MISIDNLKLVRGCNYETVVNILEDGEQKYSIEREPSSMDFYFRCSSISIGGDVWPKVCGQFDCSKGYRLGLVYLYSEYEILDGFDYSQLDGNVKFARGNLVERVTLSVQS